LVLLKTVGRDHYRVGAGQQLRDDEIALAVGVHHACLRGLLVDYFDLGVRHDAAVGVVERAGDLPGQSLCVCTLTAANERNREQKEFDPVYFRYHSPSVTLWMEVLLMLTRLANPGRPNKARFIQVLQSSLVAM